MSCTAIKVLKDGVEVKLKFLTQRMETHLNVLVYKCNQEFIPEGNPEQGGSDLDEETYHRNLRKDAASHGHFVPEESTDHYWNPDYKPEENEDTVQSDLS